MPRPVVTGIRTAPVAKRQRRGARPRPIPRLYDFSESGVSLDPTWTDGNFTVVSSDGITFRVHDFLLFWASPVFAEAHHLAQGDRQIQLFDAQLETAEIFRLFMRLVTTLKCTHVINEWHRASTFPRLNGLLLFLEKWQCNSLFDIVFSSVRRRVQDDSRLPMPLQYFRLAARFNDCDLCSDILHCQYRYTPHDGWWDRSITSTPFVPKGWTLRFYREHTIPADYLFALTKAYYSRTSSLSSFDLRDAFRRAYDSAKSVA